MLSNYEESHSKNSRNRDGLLWFKILAANIVLTLRNFNLCYGFMVWFHYGGPFIPNKF